MRTGREILRTFYDLPLLQQSQPTACLGYMNINFSFLSFCGCWGLSKSCSGMSWVRTDCADLSSKVSSCRGGGGGQAGCGFSPWKHDMMKFWKNWSSCCLYFSEPWCFRQCVESVCERPPANQAGCAWFALREVWCQAIYLPALSFPGMQSHWMLSSSWRYGFGPPTLSWFLLSLLHPGVSFYLATGSFPKLEVEFACDPCVVALWWREFSLCCFVCRRAIMIS